MYRINNRISVDPNCTNQMIGSRMSVVYAPSTNGYRHLARQSATHGVAGIGNVDGRLYRQVAGTMVVMSDNELLQLHAMCRSDCGCYNSRLLPFGGGSRQPAWCNAPVRVAGDKCSASGLHMCNGTIARRLSTRYRLLPFGGGSRQPA